MKLRAPKYYKDFHCIADKCKDCCCIGWEIDIDNNAVNFYNNLDNEFGNKLKNNIKFDNISNFILDKNDRCPFLNSKNLCDIYINLGENHLCDICKNHPRFFEWFDKLKEVGIGLCCEEACKIILLQNEKFSTYETNIPFESVEKYDNNLYTYLVKIREKIINYLDDETITFNNKIENILWYANLIQNNIDNKIFEDVEIENNINFQKSDLKPILDFFLTLDSFNPNWKSNLKKDIELYCKSTHLIEKFEKENRNIFKYLKNISIYFIWRYFLKGTFDNDILSKINLMAISCIIIKSLFFCYWLKNKKITLNDCIEITKNYSKEIEYCEENIYALENACYEFYYFSIEYLIGLFK